MPRRGSLIVVRAIDDAIAPGAPQVPASVDVIPEDGRWFTLYPLSRVERPGVFFHARLMLRQTSFTPNRGVYVCVGPQAILDELRASSVRSWDSITALRDDTSAAATAIKTAWPDERGEGDVGERVRLLARIAGFDDDDGEGV